MNIQDPHVPSKETEESFTSYREQPCSPLSPLNVSPKSSLSDSECEPDCHKPIATVKGLYGPAYGSRDLSKKSRKKRLHFSHLGTLSLKKRDPSPELPTDLKARPSLRREPLPMRKRALPQSFFQEPKSMTTSSLAGSAGLHSLPPLFSDGNPNDDLTKTRPVTPPEERSAPRPPRPPKYVIKGPPNTELLFSLFESVEPNHTKKYVVKRGRPRKVHPDASSLPPPRPKKDDDPYMVTNLSDKLFPQLSLQHKSTASVSLGVVNLQDGDKSVLLPALSNEQNYSAMLTEIVQNM